MTDLVQNLAGALEELLHECEQGIATSPHARIEARSALSAAKAGGWQDISTAPKDGTRFIAWRKHSTHPLVARYWKDFDWFEDEDGLHLYNLTHWQPLPNPPKEQA